MVSGGPIASLAVGATDTTTFTAVHTITQADINAGIVYNLATANAKDPKNNNITATSTDPTPCTTCTPAPDCRDCTITELNQSPSISITKDGTYVDSNNDGKTNVGDVVSYVFVVKNTGNVTLTNVTVTDNNAVVSGGPIASLAVGATDTTTFTAVHTITQADINAGIVYNLATANAKDPKNNNITATSTDPTPCTTCPPAPDCRDCTITILNQNPVLNVVKVSNTEFYSNVGDQIKYTIQVQNTGNVTLHNISVTDPLTGLDNIISSLDPGTYQEYEVVYTVKQIDRVNLSVTNIAFANGFTPNNTPISASDSEIVEANIVAGCGNIIVHNAFSPNGDGKNEEFIIENIEDILCYPTNTLEIYNRWGILVYETQGYDNVTRVFKGVSEGRTTVGQSSGLPAGTYYYILNYTSIDGLNNANNNTKDGYLYLAR
ncbi:gliding motility-associated C-terminal domain-containing protein [Flavobacterium faecale]